MYTNDFTVQLEHGLHLRPAANLVALAKTFKSDITLTVDNVSINAKSLFELQMLEIAPGTKLTISANGEDETEAVQSMIKQLTDNSETTS